MLFKRSQILTYSWPSTSHSPIQPTQNPQTLSIFLNRLPAELRNEIYTLVFTTSAYQTLKLSASNRPPHPLSLIQTCRQIHNEASFLAFTTHTFPLRPSLQPTYLGLQTAITHLSPPQVNAIRSLSVLSSLDVNSLLSNALLLFPSLDHFVITTTTTTTAETRPSQGCSHVLPPRLRSSRPGHCFTSWSEATELSLRAIDTYAPPWFVNVIESVEAGRGFRWQTGSKWTAHWPQLDSEMCYSRIQCDGAGLSEEIYMDTDAVGVVPGVSKCRCSCGEVSWTRAVLVQEGGRRVAIEVAYSGKLEPEMPKKKKKKYVPAVTLVPGTEPAREVFVVRAGIGYDADEEYWDAMRRRNGNLGALCRGLWKSAVAGWPVAA